MRCYTATAKKRTAYEVPGDLADDLLSHEVGTQE